MKPKEELLKYCIESSSTTECQCKNLVSQVDAVDIKPVIAVTSLVVIAVIGIVWLIYSIGKQDGERRKEI